MKRKVSIIEILLIVLVIAEIASLLIFNIFKFESVVNFDSSEYLIQVIQIWRQKTLLIKDYYYSTMLTWDMPTLLAVLFYGITKNVFVAYGLANDVLIIAFAFALSKLCRDLDLSRTAKLIVLASVFCVYDFGIVNYIEELFINGALYGFRLLIVILLVDVMICSHKNTMRWQEWILYMISICGAFISGISTGIFESGCCLLPIFLMEMFGHLHKKGTLSLKTFWNRECISSGIALVISLVGVVVNHQLGLKASLSEEKYLAYGSDLGERFINNIEGIFQLFGVTDGDIALISVRGIIQLCCVCVALLMIAMSVYAIVVFGGKLKERRDDVQYYFCGYAVCALFINFFLFSFVNLSYSGTGCEFRYWLIVFIYNFVLLGMFFDKLQTKIADGEYKVGLGVLAILLVVITSGQSYRMYHQTSQSATYRNVMDTAQKMGIENLFIYSDYFSARVMSTYVPESMTAYAVNMDSIDDQGRTWIFNTLRMPRWGTYVKYDGDCMQIDKVPNVGYVINAEIGYDTDMMLKRAKQCQQIKGTNFYVITLDKNYLDFQQGFPQGDAMVSRDYFNQGCEMTNVDLDEKGNYISGNDASLTYRLQAHETGKYKLTLHYKYNRNVDTQSEIGSVEVAIEHQDGSQTRQTIVIKAQKTDATIEDIQVSDGDSYSIMVQLNVPKIELDYIEYQTQE